MSHKDKLKRIVVKWLQGMIEYLILFPIILLIGVYLIPDVLVWIWTIPFIFLLGVILRTYLIDKKRWVYVVLALIVSIGYSVVFPDGIIVKTLIFLTSFVIFFRGVLYGEREWKELLPMQLLWIGGFSFYFVGYFFYRFIDNLFNYIPVLTSAGITLVVITLFTSNSLHLKEATLSKESKPIIGKGIKRQNQTFIFLTLLFIFAASNFQIVQEFLFRSVRGIIQAIIWFITLFGSDEEIEEEPVPQTNQEMQPLEQGEPSLLMVILEKIMVVVLVIGMIIAVLFLLYYLYKKLRKWLKVSQSWLSRFLNQLFTFRDDNNQVLNYQDEKESVFDWNEWKKHTQSKAKELVTHLFKRKPNWNDLSSREKARYVYNEWIHKQVKRGFNFRESNTPKENIIQYQEKHQQNDKVIDSLAEVYGQARYGNGEIDEKKIERLSSLIDK